MEGISDKWYVTSRDFKYKGLVFVWGSQHFATGCSSSFGENTKMIFYGFVSLSEDCLSILSAVQRWILVFRKKITVSLMITILMIYVAGRDWFSWWHYPFLLFQNIRAGFENWLVSSQIFPPFFFLMKGCRNEHRSTKFPFTNIWIYVVYNLFYTIFDFFNHLVKDCW